VLRTAGVSLLVVLIGMAEVAYGHGPGLYKPATPQVAFVLIGAGALLLRRRHPRTVAVITTLCGTALPVVAPHEVVVDAATIVALYTVAETTDRRSAATLGAVAAVLLTASSMLWLPGHFLDIHNTVPVNYVAAAAAVGDSVRNQRALLRQERQRAADAEHTREAEAGRQVREERVRIARELHDVVAHHITLVNAQAGVAHHLLGTDPDRARQALAGIKETSRAALDELRATVGLLRADDEPETLQPAPSLAQLDRMIESFRDAGLHVGLTRQGAPRPLTAPAGLAAYRIVQEALTNASKHGITRAQTDLDLSYTGRTLDITVTNPASPGRRGPGTGHGLIGMRERAESAGGRFSADLQTGGDFVVRASLPLAVAAEPAP
jgi:signal transduction histidine kinase